jgi:hypothetical protein
MAGPSAKVTHNVRGFSPAVRDFKTSVKKAAAELAATDGVSLNQFIAAAAAERVGSLPAADDFLRERGNGEAQGHAQVSAPRTEGCTER